MSAPLPEYVRVEPARAPGVPAISVVVPAYNEARRLPPYLEKLGAYFAARKEPHEILVVSDGSRDETVNVARKFAEKFAGLSVVHYEKNRGKGHAVRMGMLAARGNLRLFSDADGSTPIEELERLRPKVEREGFDVAVGSRAVSSPEVHRHIRPHRFVIGQVFRFSRQALLSVRVMDSQCGFKLFSARAARAIFPVARVDGFAFDVEALFLATRFGFKTAEVAVNWEDDADSRVNLLIDPWKMLRDMLRVRTLHRRTEFDLPAEAPEG